MFGEVMWNLKLDGTRTIQYCYLKTDMSFFCLVSLALFLSHFLALLFLNLCYSTPSVLLPNWQRIAFYCLSHFPAASLQFHSQIHDTFSVYFSISLKIKLKEKLDRASERNKTNKVDKLKSRRIKLQIQSERDSEKEKSLNWLSIIITKQKWSLNPLWKRRIRIGEEEPLANANYAPTTSSNINANMAQSIMNNEIIWRYE